jgi:hypothetical protein
MDKLCELIKQANEIIINNNPVQIINNLEITINNQKEQIILLSDQLKIIDNKYLEQINKLNADLEHKTNELKITEFIQLFRRLFRTQYIAFIGNVLACFGMVFMLFYIFKN